MLVRGQTGYRFFVIMKTIVGISGVVDPIYHCFSVGMLPGELFEKFLRDTRGGNTERGVFLLGGPLTKLPATESTAILFGQESMADSQVSIDNALARNHTLFLDIDASRLVSFHNLNLPC